jgi:hypothetical protein
MANVTDSSSLLVVPSGWSDGVLGSLKPDDGSGDFTFSRGSDLSATRVNEDGYIEKGYENLLLQSNSFDLSPWTTIGVDVPIGGQSGYDGTNDAWKINATTNISNIRQTRSQTGVITLSVYAKKGEYDYVGLYFSGDGVGVIFSLIDGGVENPIVAYPDVYTNGESVGNGWFRFSITHNSSSTGIAGIYACETTSYSGNTTFGEGIYIQDAMLNQGLSAYPYIETTTTTAKAATISEDQPRIDYTSGNGALLIEPSRTNFVPSLLFNTFNGASYTVSTTKIGEGMPLQHFTKNSLAQYAGHILNGANVSVGDVWTFSCFFKPISGSNGFNKVSMEFYGQGSSIVYDYSTEGFFANPNGTPLPSNIHVETYPDGVYKIISIQTSTVTTNRVNIYVDAYYNDNSEFLCGYAQAEKNESSASSYIPTYGTTATRAKDTATLTKNVAATGTIFININADSAKTLTFLGGNVSVTQGVNKIALAYSPTALKISHNGSIVQNIARAFDTSSLTEIQLGHRNNFEQTTDSINQFLTLDSFLTDTELNELTA